MVDVDIQPRLLSGIEMYRRVKPPLLHQTFRPPRRSYLTVMKRKKIFLAAMDYVDRPDRIEVEGQK